MSPRFAACFILLLFLTTAIPSLAGEITIINKSGSAVSSVMISKSGSSVWFYVAAGIGKDGKVTFTFDDAASECCFDIRFIDQGGKSYEMGSINLCVTTEISLDGTKAEETFVKYFMQKVTK